MNDEKKVDDEMPKPENPGIDGKAELPDPDITDPAELPTNAEELEQPAEKSNFRGEHKISRDHAEPTNVTETTNDNAIEGKYIDVGGGD
jgi:hypothetical protein